MSCLIHRVSQEESDILLENAQYVKLHRSNKKCLFLKLNSYGYNDWVNLKNQSHYTFIADQIFKRGGICSSCSFNTCA